MSTEKPKKRLVGWGQFIDVLLRKAGTYSLALVIAVPGFVALLGVLYVIVGHFVGVTPQIGKHDDLLMLIMAVLYTAVFAGITWFIIHLFKAARQIEPVALITKHNTGSLPEVETLVRGSGRPPTAQQAELLRATGEGSETLSEQLLRATQGSRQDV